MSAAKAPPRRASVQLDHARRLRRAAECEQLVTAQHKAADVSLDAVLRVFEAEAALEPEPAVVAAAEPQAVGVDRLVKQLHAGGLASIAADLLGAFGGGARGTPESEGRGADDHQDQEGRHAPNVGPAVAAGKPHCRALHGEPVSVSP